jgi:hypothetical protein
VAALPTIDPQTANDAALNLAAAQMTQFIEEYYDEIGLSETERDERYASAREFLDSKNAATAKP